MNRREAIEHAVARKRGASDDVKRALATVFRKAADLHAQCPKCGLRFSGSMTELSAALAAHECRG